jgi:hypothetical protein
MKKYSIKVITITYDNGDGSSTTDCFNTEEEMLANHRQAMNGELTKEQKKEILSGEDGYENGYIGTETIEIVIENGVAKLATPLSVYSNNQ